MKYIYILFILSSIYACNTSKQGYKEENPLPKNIIFMIGDGMGLTQIQAAMTVNGNYLNFERFKTIGLSKTSSLDKYITDSAAGATAFSIGKKTYNGAIGVNADTLAEKTILEYAEEAGMSTGLIATSAITHATPASFIAHQPSRYMGEEIAYDFLKTDIDVFIGGGKNHFVNRKDGLNLIDSLAENGYQVVDELEEMKDIHTGKIAGLLSADAMPTYEEGRGDMLMVSTLKALEVLSKNEEGFFLMIEGSQIDWGGHMNDPKYVVNELLDFDKVIGTVLDFSEKEGNTLVIITADHETGGLTILNDKIMTDTASVYFSTNSHTPVMVPVFAKGPGQNIFSGIYENTQIFNKMMFSLGLTIEN